MPRRSASGNYKLSSRRFGPGQTNCPGLELFPPCLCARRFGAPPDPWFACGAPIPLQLVEAAGLKLRPTGTQPFSGRGTSPVGTDSIRRLLPFSQSGNAEQASSVAELRAQKSSFSPNWITRGPPSPSRGLLPATSGVEPMVPNAELSNCTLGTVKLGWLNMLKNSERN